jgi:hypothetical protein
MYFSLINKLLKAASRCSRLMFFDRPTVNIQLLASARAFDSEPRKILTIRMTSLLLDA